MVGPMASNIKMLWHRHALRSRFRLSGAHAVLQGLRSRARLTSTSAFQDKTVWVEPRVEVPGSETGPLRGATFAVKDLFDVAGQATGFGNPQWRDSHPVPDTTAPVVQWCLESGARLMGKVQMDELAYSLNGENRWYGTPPNIRAPGRVPGGSSSGSAAAVQSGEVDFALGSDTAGSVRVPASHCGLFGIRTTWGRIPLTGARPLAQSFDTVGWFARDAVTLERVGSALLARSAPGSKTPLTSWVFPVDLWDLASPTTGYALSHVLLDRLRGSESLLGSEPRAVDVGDPGGVGTAPEWLDSFRVLQAREVWTNHGDWVTQQRPQFGPGIKERFEMASQVTEAEAERAQGVRQQVEARVASILGQGAVMVIPTAPEPAPRRGLPGADLEDFRRRALSLTCVAGLCGLPQVSIPAASVPEEAEGAWLPVGLSLVGPKGSDEALLRAAVDVAAALSRAGEGAQQGA